MDLLDTGPGWPTCRHFLSGELSSREPRALLTCVDQTSPGSEERSLSMVKLGVGRGLQTEFLAPYFSDEETGAPKEEVNHKFEKWKS